MNDLAAIAVRDAVSMTDAMDAEQWASCLIGTWHIRPLPPGDDVEALFFPGFIAALEQLARPRALATLRALGAVAGGVHGERARAAADRLASRGVAEPPWSDELGRARPTTAAVVRDEVFDDGTSVLIEFADAGAEPHTLGIYIDHNMGGLVKDTFLAGPMSSVRGELALRAANEIGATIEDLDLAEARAHVEAALYMLDHTLDPPVSDDVRMMRAFIDARVGLLPDGFELPETFEEVSATERDELLADFLASRKGRRWSGDEDAEDIVRTAIDFGADYNRGGPLRWSGVVVEIFMTSWLARKIAREPEFFARVAEVLPDWVAYAGRRRGVPAKALRNALAAVEEFREEMLDNVDDPHAWGPAKSFAVAAQQAGVDLSDPDAVGRFIERYNEGMAA